MSNDGYRVPMPTGTRSEPYASGSGAGAAARDLPPIPDERRRSHEEQATRLSQTAARAASILPLDFGVEDSDFARVLEDGAE